MRGWADSSSRTLREKTDWFEYITLSRHGPCGPNVEQGRSPLSRNCADKSFVFEGAVSCVFWRWPAGQLWILLGKGGEAAPSKAAKPPSPAQTGWLVQKNCLAVLNQPPRPRLSKERGYFLMARPPLLCQGGESAPPQRSAGRYFS